MMSPAPQVSSACCRDSGNGGLWSCGCLNSAVLIVLLSIALVTLLSGGSAKEMVAGLPVLLYVDPGDGRWTLILLGGVSRMLTIVSVGACDETGVVVAAFSSSSSSDGSGSPV